MRRFAAPFAFVLLVSALVPGGAGAGGQHFTDETLQRMPALADRSTDADFGDIDGDGDQDIVVSNGVSSDQPNLVYINASGTDLYRLRRGAERSSEKMIRAK